MTCDVTRVSIEAWNPLGDLDDDVVAHLDRCTECRAAFDARFPSPIPVREPARAVSAGRARPSWAPAISIVAVAAMGLLTLLPGPPPSGLPRVAMDLSECDSEPWLPPECPTT